MTKELYLLAVLVLVLGNALLDVACSVERQPLSYPPPTIPQSQPQADDECAGLPMAQRIPCFTATHPRR